MSPMIKFLIRAVLALVAGFFLTKVFLHTNSLPWILALSALLVVLAYLLEGMRKEKKE